MGSPLATSTDGYFRYIAESVVSADFTEAKQRDRMCKIKCCIQIIVGICCTEKCPEAFMSCFKLCEPEVISVLVNTIPGTKM